MSSVLAGQQFSPCVKWPDRMVNAVLSEPRMSVIVVLPEPQCWFSCQGETATVAAY